jgi:hypothetical protein
MAKQQSDHLFRLIKSLSKAEKRSFKLFANRIGTGEDLKFISLFDILDKQSEYNEEEIYVKAPAIKPVQLPNLKANLTKNLMVSLRLMAQQSDVDINLRQQLDFAKILYNKALYKQSLTTLDKAKQQAIKHHRDLLYYEMVEFEKLIELQYINRTIDSRVNRLTVESDQLNQRLMLSGALSNLTFRLYSFFLRNGYVRSKEDQKAVTDYFNRHLPAFSIENLGFFEKLNLYQSYVWFYLISQDFLMVFRYSLKWVELFRENPEVITVQPDLYIKGLNNLLDGLYFTTDFTRFDKTLNELGEIRNQSDFTLSKNAELLLNQYYFTHLINWHFMQGWFSEGVTIVPEIVRFISDNELYLDNHVVLVFYYKIASLYFGSGDHKNAAKYLNMVINYKDAELRGDIQCFARILNLIAHFEMENFDLIEYLVKTTYRFLSKMKDLHRAQKEILFFLRRLPNISPDKLNDAFLVLLNDLKRLQDDPFEKRPFLYLDIISWLESKVYNVPVQQVIRQKHLTGHFEL